MERMFITILIIFGIYKYLQLNIEWDEENKQLIIHYTWRGVRKTYIL